MVTLDIDSVEICPWALREGIILRHSETMTESEPGDLPLGPLRRGDQVTVTALRPEHQHMT